MIGSLERDGEKKVPAKKADLITRLREWETRGYVVVEDKVAIVVAKYPKWVMRIHKMQNFQRMNLEW